MVYKVDGNRQLDSRDWSMYSNILNKSFSEGCFPDILKIAKMIITIDNNQPWSIEF